MKKQFTLIEIMLSMAILMLIVIFMTNFLKFTQSLWMRSKNKSSLFQEANIAFTNMEEDFLTNYNYSDNDIPSLFWNEGSIIHFVSSKEYLNDTIEINLNEISYRYKNNELQRRDVNPQNSDFNVIDVIKSIKSGADVAIDIIWTNNSEDDFHTVIPNVKNLEFSCEDSNFEVTTEYPTYLRINLTLMPQESFSQEQDILGENPTAEEIANSPFKKYERTFSKLIKIRR